MASRVTAEQFMRQAARMRSPALPRTPRAAYPGLKRDSFSPRQAAELHLRSGLSEQRGLPEQRGAGRRPGGENGRSPLRPGDVRSLAELRSPTPKPHRPEAPGRQDGDDRTDRRRAAEQRVIAERRQQDRTINTVLGVLRDHGYQGSGLEDMAERYRQMVPGRTGVPVSWVAHLRNDSIREVHQPDASASSAPDASRNHQQTQNRGQQRSR